VDESQMELRVAACSDRGKVRDRNEDAFAADPPPPGRAATHGRLFLVADGMGGHEAGEVASALARDTVMRDYYAAPFGATDDPLPALREALRAANRAIRERQAREPGERDMGTTCTALAVRGASFWIAHIGDSRAYRWRAGRLQQLTRDHNWAEELLAAGRIDPTEAAHHMGRHMITRALGIDPEAQVDLLPGKPLEPADRLLLCSDGLSGVVGEEEIAAILATPDPESAVASLVAAANQADGPDNITVVLIEARAT
jgi:serine/threonine protein phosphatase PrpC